MSPELRDQWWIYAGNQKRVHSWYIQLKTYDFGKGVKTSYLVLQMMRFDSTPNWKKIVNEALREYMR